MVCQLRVIDDAESTAFAAPCCWIRQAVFVDIKTRSRYFLSRPLTLFQFFDQFENFIQRSWILALKPSKPFVKNWQSFN